MNRFIKYRIQQILKMHYKVISVRNPKIILFGNKEALVYSI